MKTNFRLKTVILLVFVLICLLFLVQKRDRLGSPATSHSTKVTAFQESSSKNSVRRREAVDDLTRHPDVILVANSMQIDPTALAGRALKSKSIMESKNVPVKFYGQVVDQNEQPMAGVAVRAHSREWHMKNPFQPEAKMHYDGKTTGADGLFAFDSFHGDTFFVDSISKEGYILTTKTEKGYSYGPLKHHYVPNPLVPVIFRMWKTNGAVPLFVVSFNKSIPQDGTVLSFDLRRSKRVAFPSEHTDLRITLAQHAPPGQRNARVPFDWNFTIEVPNGGLVETQDEFLYLAPEQGYQSKWSVAYLKDHPEWKARREVHFYLRNRGGQQYGCLKVDFRPEAGDTTGFLSIEGYLNPNGRVLEYDVLKKLYPGPTDALVTQPVQRFGPSGAPVAVNPPQTKAPFILQPPPGFQALTNRATPFAPPILPRP